MASDPATEIEMVVESVRVHMRTGRHVRTVEAPVSLRRLPPSGTLVAFPLHYQVSLFDVSTGRRSVSVVLSPEPGCE